MSIWMYIPDSDNHQTLAMVDHELDGQLFHEDNFRLGKPFPEPLPTIPVIYQKEYKELSKPQQRLARQGKLPRGDFPSLYGIEVIFSERALQVLWPLIQNSVQVIPLECEEGKLYLIHITNTLDVLDRAQSKIKWLSGYEDKIVFQVDHYVFHEERIVGETIFKVPEMFTSTFVSDMFREAVEEHGLKGLIWKPLP